MSNFLKVRVPHIHRSLMVRMAGFHPADPGSIPGDEATHISKRTRDRSYEPALERVHWFESSCVLSALAWELLERKTSVGIQLLQARVIELRCAFFKGGKLHLHFFF